jgi:hypothetical protein
MTEIIKAKRPKRIAQGLRKHLRRVKSEASRGIVIVKAKPKIKKE